ncbi:hypothetical protein HZC00_05615 [Candidatus Kaiserbacteria bacterium]|nr:hypothetical protein [Candidatus Kaiserbacteria bacterium]
MEQLAELIRTENGLEPVFLFPQFFEDNREKLGPDPDYAVLILTRVVGSDGSLKGYITVKDSTFGDEAEHKFASGRRNLKRDQSGMSDKSVHATADNELTEESGVTAAGGPESFKIVYGRVCRNPRNNPGWHAKFLCVVDVLEFEIKKIYNPEMNPKVSKPKGNEGEVGFFHPPGEFRDLFAWEDFFFVHRQFLKSAENILKSLDLWPL